CRSVPDRDEKAQQGGHGQRQSDPAPAHDGARWHGSADRALTKRLAPEVPGRDAHAHADRDLLPDHATGPRRVRNETIVTVEDIADESGYEKQQRRGRRAEGQPEWGPPPPSRKPVSQEVPGTDERHDCQNGNQTVQSKPLQESLLPLGRPGARG